MDEVASIFNTVKDFVGNQLKPKGYNLIKDISTHEIFGSRYAEFQLGDQTFQIIWDGKEGWFLLQFCRDIRLKGPFRNWQEISLQRFDVHHADPFRKMELVEIIETAFIKFISQIA